MQRARRRAPRRRAVPRRSAGPCCRRALRPAPACAAIRADLVWATSRALVRLYPESPGAGVAELANAPGLGPGELRLLEVRVLSPALSRVPDRRPLRESTSRVRPEDDEPTGADDSERDGEPDRPVAAAA